MGMIFKAVGLPPRGRLSDVAAKLAWRLLQWRQHRFAHRLAKLGAPLTGGTQEVIYLQVKLP